MEQKTKNQRYFAWQSLLYLLAPAGMIVFPFFPLFKSESLAVVGIVEGQGGIFGDSVSGYTAFGYSGAPLVLYWIGVAIALCLAVFGIASAFLPILRQPKPITIALFASTSGIALFDTLAMVLFAVSVDKTSKRWLYEIENRDVTFVSAYGYGNLFFYLILLLPIAFLGWWIGVYINRKRRAKK